MNAAHIVIDEMERLGIKDTYVHWEDRTTLLANIKEKHEIFSLSDWTVNINSNGSYVHFSWGGSLVGSYNVLIEIKERPHWFNNNERIQSHALYSNVFLFLDYH